MKDLESRLTRERSPMPQRQLRDDFTTNVVSRLEGQPHGRSWHERSQELYMKFNQLPRFAALAIIAAGVSTLGGATYAAYQWLAPLVTINDVKEQNDDNRREYSVTIENCGVVRGGTPISNGVKHFEVSPKAGLTDVQVQKVIKDTCTYQAAFEFSQAQWTTPHKDIKDMSPAKAETLFELANRPGTGTITGLTPTSFTLTTTIYTQLPEQHFGVNQSTLTENKTTYFPEGKKVSYTYNLDAEYTYWQGKTQLAPGGLKVGDVVYVANITDDATVDGLIKVDLDTDYVLGPLLGNPAIAGPVFELVACDKTPEYLCRSKNNLFSHTDLVYLASQYSERAPGEHIRDASEYIRTDIPEDGSMFHSVEGRILSIDGNSFKIRSRGTARDITVTLGYDAFKEFNDLHEHKIAVGDMVEVDYFQKNGEDPTNITSKDVYGLQLCEYQLPDGSYAKY